ncbi:MAG: arginine--tRNA ligase [bacterium]|nr:arginine--tRNA ligase [bacterium]
MHARLKGLIVDIFKDANLPEIEPQLREIPFEGQMGLALSNLFQIARVSKPDLEKDELKKYAGTLADLIAEKIRNTGDFEKVEAVKGYVNCFFKPQQFTRELLGRILGDGTDWARMESHGGRVMIEYSQPNTHKAFHIGHVRNAVTGASLVRCYRYAGRDTIAANYYGDIGSHVFKALWYLGKYHPDLKDAPDGVAERGKWLGEIYADAQKKLTDSENLLNQVWEILKPLNKILYNAYGSDEATFGLYTLPFNVRGIARNEEDLFEGRSNNDVIKIVDWMASQAKELRRRAGDIRIEPFGDLDWVNADTLLLNLNQIRSQSDYHQRLNRPIEVLDIANRWKIGDPKLLDLYNETRQWSFDDFKRIYNEIGVEFDVEFKESEVEREGLLIAIDLEKQGIVVDSMGAAIVEIDNQLKKRFGEPMQDKYRVLVLVREDGSSLYGSKDLALAKLKFEEYGIDESIYVVGNEQKFYFQQLFQVLRLMGFPQWERCFHLSYELVMLPGGKISSREGQVVLYDDVISELRDRALSVVKEKNPGLDDEIKVKISEIVAMGALIFGMLRVDTNKVIRFDFDEVLDFDGRSAPYIQYAGARAMSILRKAESEGIETPNDIALSDFNRELLPVEIELVKILNKLPEHIIKVVEDKKPFYLTNYAYDLAVKFSDFYHQCPVLTSEETVRRDRLLLVKAVRINIETSLGLLGIATPDVM